MRNKTKVLLCAIGASLCAFGSAPSLFAGGKGDTGASARPVWIDALHDFDSADGVYFVGKSAEGDSENYLETKGSAVADVLSQFALYKEVKIQSMLSSYESEGDVSSSYESVLKIVGGNIDTGGLYQCEEYIDPRGMVFVRFVYRKNSPVFERFMEVPKEISEYWEPSKDKVYFLSTVWSANKNAWELRALAKEDAALQASLWLGSSLSFVQEQYETVEVKNRKETYSASSTIAMKCVDSYQTLQEEGYVIGERKTSGVFSCTALYSLKRDAAVSRPGIKEMQSFTFSLQADGGQGTFSGEKSVAFSEHEYSSKIRETAALQKQGKIPVWAIKPPRTGDALIGIGIGTNDWNSEAQKYQAQGNAVAALGRISSSTADLRMTPIEAIGDYLYESRSTTAITLSGLKKVREAQTGGTDYQMWQIPQEAVDKALKDAGIGR